MHIQNDSVTFFLTNKTGAPQGARATVQHQVPNQFETPLVESVEDTSSLRPYPTVPGQMANPLAIIAPRPGLCSALILFGFVCLGKISFFFSFLLSSYIGMVLSHYSVVTQ
ncbi:hypothetical protein Tco_0616224 [Tanacetum coccineum]